jgi:hypothetical protein
MDRKRWTGSLAHALSLLTDFFLWDSMMLQCIMVAYQKQHNQLVEATDEATVGIRKELGCMQSDGGHFKHML